MQTELQFSIIYLANKENDINEFEFFIRGMLADDKRIISVLSVPKFTIDGETVKHLNFSVQSQHLLEAENILMIISRLANLENIVKDVNLSTEDAEKQLKETMVTILDQFGKE